MSGKSDFPFRRYTPSKSCHPHKHLLERVHTHTRAREVLKGVLVIGEASDVTVNISVDVQTLNLKLSGPRAEEFIVQRIPFSTTSTTSISTQYGRLEARYIVIHTPSRTAMQIDIYDNPSKRELTLLFDPINPNDTNFVRLN